MSVCLRLSAACRACHPVSFVCGVWGVGEGDVGVRVGVGLGMCERHTPSSPFEIVAITSSDKCLATSKKRRADPQVR